MTMQSDLAAVLNEITDPELGVGIVDLGLVYRAEWGPEGIDVEFTMTTPSCPYGETLFDQVEEILHQRFRDASSINVRLVWDPPWTPRHLTEAGRQRLGRAR
jgi:metal-sulfur cluster biosynthetic enzyme